MPFPSLRHIKLSAALFAVSTTALASSVQAHAKLVLAAPAANSTIATTKELKLTFSEAVVPQFSGMSILMTDMPGMEMTSPMSVGYVTSSVAADGRTLVGTLKMSLPAGTYTVSWHAVTADTHRAEGSYSFKVE